MQNYVAFNTYLCLYILQNRLHFNVEMKINCFTIIFCVFVLDFDWISHETLKISIEQKDEYHCCIK